MVKSHKPSQLAKADVSKSHSLDSVFWLISVALLVLAIAAFYYFSTSALILRVLMVLAGFGIALFVASKTQKGMMVIDFMLSTRREVRLVVWPTRQETVQMTLIVFAASVVVGIFLWLVDSLFMWAVRLLTGQGS